MNVGIGCVNEGEAPPLTSESRALGIAYPGWIDTEPEP